VTKIKYLEQNSKIITATSLQLRLILLALNQTQSSLLGLVSNLVYKISFLQPHIKPELSSLPDLNILSSISNIPFPTMCNFINN
jgi:hypothetical protein